MQWRLQAGTCILMWILAVLKAPGSCPLQKVPSWVPEFDEVNTYTSLCHLSLELYSQGEF